MNIPIAIVAVLAVPVLKESKVEGSRRVTTYRAPCWPPPASVLVWACTQPAEELALDQHPRLVGLLLGFVLVELRSTSPLLPMRILENRNRAAYGDRRTLIGAGLFAVFLFLTYYLQMLGTRRSRPGSRSCRSAWVWSPARVSVRS